MDHYIVALFALAGTLIGSGGACLAAYINARFSERTHRRELAMKMALEKFERAMTLAQQTSNASGKFTPVPPLESFVLDCIKFMEIAADKNLSPQDLELRLAQLQEFRQVIIHSTNKRQS